ncbi:hypothetical protein dqs_0062 [Azoarcus olearius]|uniref:alpha/beta fold hydrolase n=1 Tax=Azoarcus sp. (strain BH72) TaxID=418699 RepID=UPI0008062D2A|nr:alpha/beta fold hydrolase [Azoarcus olearius]ANQ83145.1 hypothetical protein dqs_0062 [Azoarcus olearius]
MPRWLRLLGLAGACLALAGCTLIRLGDEAQAFYTSTVLVGRVAAPAGWSGPVIVAAHREEDGDAPPAHRTLLHEAGGFELIVPAGDYRLFAFGDTNRNGRFDAGEPAGEYGGGKPVAASGSGVIALLDFALGDAAAAGAAARRAAGWPPLDSRHSTQAGALAELDAPAFSAANGVDGYWAPMAFFRASGGNVYFLEPYDPARIPVLFVHGAAGSAQDWRYFYEHLDRSRYQAWIFQYPSGAAVDSMAYLLYWKLFNLQLRHRFERLHIVAHSMGGLVARSFLINHGSQVRGLGLFISISTPWAGEPTAALGVKHAPAVVPSWHDMAPGGSFMRALFARPLPAGLDYYLLFGHRGGYSLLRPNHDGTVTLASQLRQAAQAEARMIYGFDEDHVGILSSPQVLAQVQALLDSHAGGPRADTASGGQLRAAFTTADGVLPAGVPLLVLQPLGEGARVAPITVPLAATDSGRSLGPFPPGDYAASLLVQGYRAEPARQPLHIGDGAAATARFRLLPRGELAGYVGDEADAVGNPAGSYRRPLDTVRIREVDLRGAGVQRTLRPLDTAADDALALHLRGEDSAERAHFAFFDLAAGDYELTIRADGYETHRSRHTVVPGQGGPMAPIVLQPRR